jgi:hypothetical protein
MASVIGSSFEGQDVAVAVRLDEAAVEHSLDTRYRIIVINSNAA